MADNLTRHVGPATVPCPNSCNIPEGSTATEIPEDYGDGFREGRYPRLWATQVVQCPNTGECTRRMAMAPTDPDAMSTCPDCLATTVGHSHGA